ncbi:MAG: hypothetical protein JWO54_84 [Candidatus Saccharibacteria bacterium]|nr:hypothetical protein [Candidatus Saccharibacteria bacterium]
MPKGIKSTNDIFRATAERLNSYHLFSDKTIKAVTRYAQKQSEYKNYTSFFQDMGGLSVTIHTLKNGSGVPVVDIPALIKKPSGIIVVHLPMGNALDESQLYQVATVAAVNSSYRVIAFGNPSGKPHRYKQQNLTMWKRLQIAFTKNQYPLVEAELDYLQSKNIQNVYHVGYSYGALKALLESNYSDKGRVKGIIIVEPVAHSRGIKQLVGDFQSTFKPLGDYVNRTQNPTYLEARLETAKKADSAAKTLLRPINIAIGIILSHIDLIELLKVVIMKQPQAQVTVAWASESELGNDAHLKANFYNMTHSNPNIHAMRLEGDKHAVANDIYLYAAIVCEALQKSTTVDKKPKNK